jgi:hypothetical protein
MSTQFRVVVPFKDLATGAIREVTVRLSREETLFSMCNAVRCGRDPLTGFPPIENAYAIWRASLAIGGRQVWNDELEQWFVYPPPGLEPLAGRVRRAPPLQLVA